ncbi:MAG: AMP-binding protein [Desulfobacterales bacterium]|nr:AMP-binding protein [Desulfobacterales bacterium]
MLLQEGAGSFDVEFPEVLRHGRLGHAAGLHAPVREEVQGVELTRGLRPHGGLARLLRHAVSTWHRSRAPSASPSRASRPASSTTTGRDLARGEIGELIVRGPNVMKGYYKDDAATALVLRNGWLHTGDLALIDADGHIFLKGRKKRMIITSGFNVYPREVEIVAEHAPHRPGFQGDRESRTSCAGRSSRRSS